MGKIAEEGGRMGTERGRRKEEWKGRGRKRAVDSIGWRAEWTREVEMKDGERGERGKERNSKICDAWYAIQKRNGLYSRYSVQPRI